MRFLRAFLAVGAALGVCLALAGAAAAQEGPRVLAVEFENDVNPVTADFVMDQIDRANDEGYTAVVILLDTPGGLASSMDDIVEKELASKIPVIVYVSPDGGRAASAGTGPDIAASVSALVVTMVGCFGIAFGLESLGARA